MLGTNFKSFEELKSVIQIEYSEDGESYVHVTHKNEGSEVKSILESGIKEDWSQLLKWVIAVILTQPSEQQETATVGGQNGLGLEEAEAMDMER